MKRVSLADAKNRLPALLHEVEQAPVEIVRGGKGVAVIVSRAAYDRMRGRKPDAWEALERWRASVDLEALHLEDVFEGVRDRSRLAAVRLARAGGTGPNARAPKRSAWKRRSDVHGDAFDDHVVDDVNRMTDRARLLEAIDAGLADEKAGRVVSHRAVIAEMKGRAAKRKSKR